VKLVLQELCKIILYYCVFYKQSNASFYIHRIIIRDKENEMENMKMVVHQSISYINIIHECYRNSKR
jgi:hypothetical protein